MVVGRHGLTMPDINRSRKTNRDGPSWARFTASGMRLGGFVPEGHLIIARRFNAGEARKGTLVPKGRLRILDVFSHPFGTDLLFGFAHPALKRRAIFGGPFGAKERRELTDSSDRALSVGMNRFKRCSR